MYGRWVYSNEGWVWDSDEPFGWIVCHYGNWYDDEEFGWVWVPGYEWSPARVEWYVTDDEIAWAPLLPPGHHHRFAHEQWMFCPTPFFSSVEIHSHVHLGHRPEPGSISVNVYAGAPRFEFVQRFVHTPVVRVTPRKVAVSDREHPLIRIEIGDRHHHSDIVVPIGRRYRRDHVETEHERPRVIVEPRREEHERARVTVQPREEHERARIIVQPRSDEPEIRAKVEVKSRREHRDDDNDDGGNDSRERKRNHEENH